MQREIMNDTRKELSRMNREIKFRGQRTDTKEWIFGYIAEFINYLDGDGKLGIQVIKQVPSGFDRMMPAWETELIEVIQETIGQYTGLHDKNGKEIYEGDVTRAEDGEIFTVKYGEHATSEWNDNWELGFYVESTSEEEISRAIRTDIIFWVKYRALEVIGNIYENPELLEVSHE